MTAVNVSASRDAEVATEDGWSRRTELILLAVLVVAALGVRLYLLRFHDVISVDGTGYVGAARALARGNVAPLAGYGFYPVLIWLASLLTLDMETAGRLVAVVAGSFLAVPLYLLGKEFFSPRATLAACVVTAFWPTLLAWSCEVMTQAPYTLFVVTGTWCVCRMCRLTSLASGCAGGICLGLAYLTRPEASLLFPLLPLAALISLRPQPRPLVRPLAAYATTFGLLFAANLCLVHRVTGSWQLASKTAAALNNALSRYLQVTDLGYLPRFSTTGYLDIIRDYPGFITWNILRNTAITWKELVPVPLWMLALLGFCAGGLWRRIPGRLFLAATFAPFLVIIVFYYVGPEYSQPYMPVLLLWCGEGLYRGERLLTLRAFRGNGGYRRRWLNRAPVTLVLALLFTLALIVRQVPWETQPQPYRLEQDGGRRDMKNIGLMLKQNLAPGKIMTRWAHIAYYADREWQSIPNSDLASILQTAREGGVRFIIVDGALTDVRPQFGPLLGPFEMRYTAREFYVTPYNEVLPEFGLRPYLFYADVNSLGVAVYEVVR